MARAKSAPEEASPSPPQDDASASASPSAPTTPTARKTVKSSSATKPRLTAHQKNTNHKDAENKRRNAIREQFTELASLVPGAEGLERSEYVMLQKTIAHFREEMDERRRLVQELQAKGIDFDNDLVLGEEQYGGLKWTTGNVDEFETAKRKRIEKEGGLVPGSNDGDAEEHIMA
jgi:Helix-loop-helix DNA-binding domain